MNRPLEPTVTYDLLIRPPRRRYPEGQWHVAIIETQHRDVARTTRRMIYSMWVPWHRLDRSVRDAVSAIESAYDVLLRDPPGPSSPPGGAGSPRGGGVGASTPPE